jgi:hypothetical protein
VSVKLHWEGLTEFLKEFGSIPQQLHEEGMAVIREETEGAAVEIAQQYGQARHTGHLAKNVRTFYPSTSILAGIVRSASPHSHLYEFGTRQRRTQNGANRGTMPAKAVTVPIARRRRARMARRLVDLLRRKGFNVGNAG